MPYLGQIHCSVPGDHILQSTAESYKFVCNYGPWSNFHSVMDGIEYLANQVTLPLVRKLNTGRFLTEILLMTDFYPLELCFELGLPS